jgi:hypothetical protein
MLQRHNCWTEFKWDEKYDHMWKSDHQYSLRKAYEMNTYRGGDARLSTCFISDNIKTNIVCYFLTPRLAYTFYPPISLRPRRPPIKKIATWLWFTPLRCRSGSEIEFCKMVTPRAARWRNRPHTRCVCPWILVSSQGISEFSEYQVSHWSTVRQYMTLRLVCGVLQMQVTVLIPSPFWEPKLNMDVLDILIPS